MIKIRKRAGKTKKISRNNCFYEAPHRIKKTLKLMYDILGNRSIALCRELTKKHEEINRGTIEEILSVIDDMKGEMVIVVEEVMKNFRISLLYLNKAL